MSVVLEHIPETIDNTCITFCANVADESVVFTLNDQSVGDQPGLTAAIALAKLQPEIQFVEQLLNTKLKFDWINERPQKNGLSLHGFSHTGARLLIDLPYRTVESIDNTNKLETPKGLKWETLHGRLRISAPTLSVDEISNIEKGAMLLITESFDARWNVQIKIGGTAQILQGNLDLGKLQCALNTDFQTNSTEVPTDERAIEKQNTFEIYPNEPIEVSPELFLENRILSLPNTLLDQELQLIGSLGVRSQGVLAKVGKGYGLYITQTMKQA